MLALFAAPCVACGDIPAGPDAGGQAPGSDAGQDIPCDPSTAFVRAEGGELRLCDEVFRFGGSNNYYMHYGSEAMIDDVIDRATQMDLRVLRVWGFLDGENDKGVDMQPALGVYAESGFRRLDYTVMRASEAGIRLVIPLVNNWDDFGGMNQYVRWVDSASEHDDFYRDEEIRAAYKAYVAHVLGRVNSYTGVAYRDDPTIMTWELANEPRCQSDPTGATLLAWADEMSAHIRSLDDHHLIALGDEGFFRRSDAAGWLDDGSQGVDWDAVVRLPTIDYGTFHMYPDHWGWDDAAGTGLMWIQQHLDAARDAGKPVVLEEFGVSAAGPHDRDTAYRLWTDAVADGGATGSSFWLLTGIDHDGTLYPDYDGFRVEVPSSTADILAAHARTMSGEPAMHLLLRAD